MGLLLKFIETIDRGPTAERNYDVTNGNKSRRPLCMRRIYLISMII